MTETSYITTPIYYPSGKPHLGSAYTSVATDIWARWQRLDGKDTYFLTGTDEHGLKIQRKAEEQGKTPQAYVDEMSAPFREMSTLLNLSNNDFIRTTEERHKASVTKMWEALQEAGYIYKDTYSGWYCVSDEAYYEEDELVEGKAPSGHPVEWMEEESYFFKLSAFEEKLLDLYETQRDFIQPESRRNEVISFVKSGLQDISISRTTFNWGVPVPGDDKHVMYVWIDALTNYLSALGWPDGEKMKYWPAVHVVGKDILRFHAVYWPAMLMGAGATLPKKIVAHGWWTSEGKKMSKSFGNVIDPHDVVEEFGLDAVRYFLLREVPFGNDGDFSRGRFISRINTELANDLGNLFQRVLSMVQKNCKGKVPALSELSADDKAFLDLCAALPKKVEPLMDDFKFSKVLEEIWMVIGEANRYMDAQQPWALKKENPEKMDHVLRVLMESFRTFAVYVHPFMPDAAAKLQAQIGYEGKTFADLAQGDIQLEAGTPLPKPEGVFPRVEVKEAA